MSTNVLPSIGTNKTTPVKRLQEVFDLPTGRENIVSKFQKILNLGGVQKITVELGHPIKVERLVHLDSKDPIEDMPEADIDIMAAIRNANMQEFVQKGKDPFVYLFQAFYLLSQKRLKASVMLVHKREEIKNWLKLDSFLDLRELFGVELQEHPAVPEYSALLVTMDEEDPFVVTSTIKLLLEREKTQ